MKTVVILPLSVNRRRLLRHIARQRDQVLDFDILVDDARQTVNRAVADLRAAVYHRDRATVHLAHLIELCEALDGEVIA
jgi:hypothetical protein